jgi:transposase
MLLLDDGMSCEAVAKVLYLDDDTIRTWHRWYQEDGIEGLASSCGSRNQSISSTPRRKHRET